MRQVLICGVSAFALSLGTMGGAQAQSLLDDLQGTSNNLLNHMAEFEEGNWTNFAVNSGPIDASVDAGGGAAAVTESLDASGAVAIDIDGGVITGDAEGAASVAVSFGESLETASVDVGDIETMAVGAVNEGDIASAPSEVEFGAFGSEGTFSESAAEAKHTAASASYGSFEASGAFFEASGPASGVFASNFAYNNAPINASVDLGPLANADGISTMAAGAVNTGTISMGFDGSAFNSAVNGDD